MQCGGIRWHGIGIFQIQQIPEKVDGRDAFPVAVGNRADINGHVFPQSWNRAAAPILEHPTTHIHHWHRRRNELTHVPIRQVGRLLQLDFEIVPRIGETRRAISIQLAIHRKTEFHPIARVIGNHAHLRRAVEFHRDIRENLRAAPEDEFRLLPHGEHPVDNLAHYPRFPAFNEVCHSSGFCTNKPFSAHLFLRRYR